MSHRRKLLGEVLIEAGLITSAQLTEAVERQKHTPERLGRVLLSMGAGTERGISQAIATQLGLEFADLDAIIPDEQALLSLPEHLARRYQVLPLEIHNGKLRVGMVDPLDVVALDDLRHFLGQEIEPVVIARDSFLRCWTNIPPWMRASKQ